MVTGKPRYLEELLLAKMISAVHFELFSKGALAAEVLGVRISCIRKSEYFGEERSIQSPSLPSAALAEALSSWPVWR